MTGIPQIISKNEARRLAALQNYHILDTSPEQSFDDITKLAAQICNMPIAAISLIDRDRIWFKSKIGLDISEMTRNGALCNEAIKQKKLLIVSSENSTAEAEWLRHVSNGENELCFYAGMPIFSSENLALAALFVLDTRPRRLTEKQKQALIALARQVEAQFELRYKVRTLEETIEKVQNYSEKILQTQERYSSVVDNLKEVVFQTDADGKWIFLNPAWTEITGFTLEESLGENFLNFVYPSDRELNAQRFAPLIERKKEHCRHEIRYSTKDGCYRWIEVFARLTLNDRNEIVGTSGTLNDITERKLVEQALQASEARYRIVAESANDAIITIDRESRILYVNSAAERIFGYARREMENQPLMMLMPENLRAIHYRGAKRYIATGEKNMAWKGVEVPARHKDGHEFVVEISFGEFKDNGNHLFTGIIRDVTERKRIAAELLRAKEVAEAATLAKSEFLANMSHEIRTPMNSIMGLTSLLLESEMTAGQRDVLETVSYSAEALLTVINDILDFSKIEAGRLDLEIIDFDLSRTIREVHSLFTEQSLKGSNLLATDVAPEISGILRGDPGRLRQVLTNLVGNAVKFTTNGKITISARVERETAESLGIRFEVGDTGIGIAPDKIGNLFKAFSQANDSVSRQFGGTGLGLAICKQLVELMNGEIGVKSQLGKGSTFWFTALFDKGSRKSAAKSLTATSGRSRQAVKTKRPANPDSKTKILVADDNAVNRKVALLMLDRLGYQADIAVNGKDVLKALKGRFYDVILMDVQMPELDGLQTTARIRRKWKGEKEPRIIAMTANAMRGDREICLEAGMDDYLSKPISKARLQAALMKCTHRNLVEPRLTEVNETETLDFAVLDNMLEFFKADSKEVIGDLILMFREDARERLNDIRRAFTELDYEEILRRAHALKGICMNVGAAKMAALCFSLEQEAGSGPLEKAERTLQWLDAEYDRAAGALTDRYKQFLPVQN